MFEKMINITLINYLGRDFILGFFKCFCVLFFCGFFFVWVFFSLNWQYNNVIRKYLCESVSTEYISWLIYKPLANMVHNEILTDPLQN